LGVSLHGGQIDRSDLARATAVGPHQRRRDHAGTPSLDDRDLARAGTGGLDQDAVADAEACAACAG